MNVFARSLVALSSVIFTIAAIASDDTIPEGQYSLPNNGQHGDAMLERVQKLLDPRSQAHLAPLIKPAKRYLDVGAGLGSMTRFMADATGSEGSVTSVDIDTTFFDQLPQGRSNITPLHADITQLDLGEAQYDGIYVRLVFLHLTKNDNQALIERLSRALKPDGFLMVDDFVDGANPNRFAEFAQIDPRLPSFAMTLYRNIDGYMDFDLGYQIPSMMEQAGLNVVTSELTTDRARGGSVHGEHMTIAVNRVAPLVKHLRNFEALFPKFVAAFSNPQLSWYTHTRHIVVGKKPAPASQNAGAEAASLNNS